MKKNVFLITIITCLFSTSFSSCKKVISHKPEVSQTAVVSERKLTPLRLITKLNNSLVQGKIKQRFGRTDSRKHKNPLVSLMKYL
jgi:hypothetical protein